MLPIINNYPIFILFTLLVPLLIAYIVGKKKKHFQFDANNSFLKLPIVWYSIIGLLYLSLSVGLLIYLYTTPRQTLYFSSTAFNNFTTMYKFSIGILALIIPIVALLAANHRSLQTAQQNMLTNHFSHLNNFVNYVSENVNETGPAMLGTVKVRAMHKRLFPETEKGRIYLDNVYINNLNNNINSINNSFYEINEYVVGNGHHISGEFIETECKKIATIFVSNIARIGLKSPKRDPETPYRLYELIKNELEKIQVYLEFDTGDKPRRLESLVEVEYIRKEDKDLKRENSYFI